MNKIYLGLGIVVVIAVGLTSYYLGANQENRVSPVETPGPAPTPTPAPTVKVSNTAKLGEKISFNGLYITPLQVTEDSRCPLDVQCFWAGRVVLNAKLERNGKTETAIFDSLKTNIVTFEGKSISLTGVGVSSNYMFTFSSN